MANRDYGGPAYPVSTGRTEDGGFGHQNGMHTWQFPGMTLRDHFAGLALQGMNANPELLQAITSTGLTVDGSFGKMARKAYAQADAMLAAREADHG